MAPLLPLVLSGLISVLPLVPVEAVTVVSSLTSVKPHEVVRGRCKASLAAARGEVESFQLVVHAGARALPAVTIEMTPLVGRERGQLPSRVYRVAWQQLRVASNLEGGIGRWPDPLVPATDAFAGERRNAFPVAAPRGENVVAWIDVEVPRGARPGWYRGSIRARDGDRLLATLPIEVQVRSFEIPATSSLAVAFGFSAATAARGHYGRAPSEAEAAELARLYSLAALRNRISLYGGTTSAAPFEVRPDGKVAIDFGPYDREVGPFLDGTADPDGPARGAKWTAVDLRVPEKLSGSARESFVRQLVSHLEGRGWLGRYFDYTADEPPPSTHASVALRAALVKSAAPSVRRLVTSPLVPALDGAVDIWCPLVNSLDDKPEGQGTTPRSIYDERIRRGESLWWYQSCMSHGCDIVGGGYFSGWPALVIDAPPVAHRILEWLSYRYRVGGELYYDTVQAYDGGDPWIDVLRHGGNGDGTLFYPGRPDRIGGTSHIPVESVRLKRIRDGLEDYEYLRLLSSLGGHELAEGLVTRIAARTFRWNHDAEALFGAREELARAIEERLAKSVNSAPRPSGGPAAR